MAKKQNSIKTEDESMEVVAPTKKAEAQLIMGTAANCFKLNIRSKPTIDSDVLSVVDVHSTLMIDETKSKNEWYFVIDVAGTSGYCMKQYVKTN